jgi:uncharacterized protein involved in outer membrane biogenesis
MNKFKIIAPFAVLGVLVLAAAFAPRFLDQNSLRAWVGPELQRALHQGVAIDGAIDIALLPRPMVTARQVSVTRQERKIADIPEIEATLKIWPLLIGRLEPEELVLSHPELHLDGPKQPGPPAALPEAAPVPPSAQSAPPAEAPVAAAAFKGFAPRNIGRVIIDQGTLSLPGLTLSPLDLTIVTGDDSLSVSGRVGAGPGSAQIDGDAHWLDGQVQSTNLAMRFEGGAQLRWTGQGDPLSADHPLSGKLSGRIDQPAALLGERAPTAASSLSADITVKPGQVDAANLLLSIGPAELRGDGQFIPGDLPRAALHLHAATIDLEKMPSEPAKPAPASAPSAVSLPPPPSLAPPAAAEPRRPLAFLRDAAIQLTLSADQILWRGQILQDARLDLTAADGALTVNQAVVTLPGNSQISLAGSIAEDARFVGSFEAKSDDLRDLLRWAGLDPARVPADRLRAARMAGRLTGDVKQITLEGVRLKVDSSQLDFSAAIRPGPRPAVGLTVALDTLNGDAYWPAVAPARAPDPISPPAPEAGGPVVPGPTPNKSGIGLDAEVHGHIGHLIWRGQNVNDVALDTTITADGITVRSLSAGDLAGAQASVTGVVSQTAAGWHIDHAKATLHSRDIGRTLRTLGIDLPLVGQADLTADLSGPWAQPSMAVTSPSLTLDKASLAPVAVTVALPPGRILFDHLAAGLYGGQLSGEGAIARDGGPSNLHLALTGAQMKKALLEVADIGLADGELSGEVDLTSSGKLAEMKANLAGTGSLSVKNGQIRGFDLKAADDKLKGQQGIAGLLALLQAGLTGGDTHFASLTGTAKADHGVIISNDLKLDAEGGGATGAATIDLPANTIDAHADFRFANAHDAPPLTMRLQGALNSPHRYLDVKPLQQWLADHGLKTGKPKDVLKGLLQGLVK